MCDSFIVWKTTSQPLPWHSPPSPVAQGHLVRGHWCRKLQWPNLHFIAKAADLVKSDQPEIPENVNEQYAGHFQTFSSKFSNECRKLVRFLFQFLSSKDSLSWLEAFTSVAGSNVWGDDWRAHSSRWEAGSLFGPWRVDAFGTGIGRDLKRIPLRMPLTQNQMLWTIAMTFFWRTQVQLRQLRQLR